MSGTASGPGVTVNGRTMREGRISIALWSVLGMAAVAVGLGYLALGLPALLVGAPLLLAAALLLGLVRLSERPRRRLAAQRAERFDPAAAPPEGLMSGFFEIPRQPGPPRIEQTERTG